MCGRYLITTAPEAMRRLFRYPEQPNFPARYNVAPTQPVPIVRMWEGARQFALVRWGFLPAWVKDPKNFSLLFNARGEVIGMNTAIVGGGSGIGFAVPSSLIKSLMPQLEKSGAVTRGWLGLAIQDLTADLAKGLRVPAQKGALVSAVNDGSPAKKAGLQTDDVIVAVDGEDVDC